MFGLPQDGLGGAQDRVQKPRALRGGGILWQAAHGVVRPLQQRDPQLTRHFRHCNDANLGRSSLCRLPVIKGADAALRHDRRPRDGDHIDATMHAARQVPRWLTPPSAPRWARRPTR
jgi:hypothetical protein